MSRLASSQPAGEWQTWDLNLGGPTPEANHTLHHPPARTGEALSLKGQGKYLTNIHSPPPLPLYKFLPPGTAPHDTQLHA